ncbi:MAG: hypothetical protein ACI8P0_004022 [Planctomycetaceae bacterium]|jgi:hypothetical protein
MNVCRESRASRATNHKRRCRWCLAVLATFFVSSYPYVAKAVDEAESFALLVETLRSTEDANVRSALMRGMLRGLEGRRNVAAVKGRFTRSHPECWFALWARHRCTRRSIVGVIPKRGCC